MSDLGKDSLEKAAGAGLTMELAGKVYEVKPFTLGDFTALRKHIKSQRINEFMGVAKDLPAEERQKIIIELSSQPVTDELLLSESTSLSGLSFLLNRSLKACNPEITDEEIDQLITNQINEEDKDLLSAIHGLNGGEESENPPQSEEKS